MPIHPERCVLTLQNLLEDTSRTFVEQLQDDHPQAWGVFERVYRGFIHNNLSRTGVSPNDIDDVCQDVLLSVARAVAKFEFQPRTASFRAWLKTLTINRGRDYLRKSRRQAGVLVDADLRGVVQRDAVSSSDEADRVELEQLYARATGELRNYFRDESIEIFIALIRGSSVAELASDTGKSPAAIRQTKVRVLHRLRQIAGE